jgi:hypothetical protein
VDTAPAEEAERFTALLLAMSYADPQVRPLLDLEGLRVWREGRSGGRARSGRAARGRTGWSAARPRTGAWPPAGRSWRRAARRWRRSTWTTATSSGPISRRLYAHAAATQWDPATAVDRSAPVALPDEIEAAVVQVMTYLVENERPRW